jgi:leader peptidase (prepilin peptidase)/N-methyltransferase
MLQLYSNDKPQLAILLIAIIVGLCVGKFLYYIINMLPAKLMHTWKTDSQEFLFPNIDNKKKINNNSNLWQYYFSNSLAWWYYLPIIDYFSCKRKPSIILPIIEILTSACTFLIVYLYGVTVLSIAFCILFWFLIPLAAIDIKTQLLPDELTLTLLWIGLLINSFDLLVTSQQAIIGSAVGYISLWLVHMTFKFFTGKEGIGYGDFKLFAAFGAWFGFMKLPTILLAASLMGTLFGVTMILLKKITRSTAFPFGPFLIIAAACIAMFSY